MGLEVRGKASTASDEFVYVIGTDPQTATTGLISLFRLTEVISRLGTLAVMQQAVRMEFPTSFPARLSMVAALAVSCALLLCVGFWSKPHQQELLLKIFPAVFAFPSPLLVTRACAHSRSPHRGLPSSSSAISLGR